MRSITIVAIAATLATAAGLAATKLRPGIAPILGGAVGIPANMPVPPTQVGINVYTLGLWVRERNFANLAVKEQWRATGPGAPPGWPNMDAGQLTANGSPASLASGIQPTLPIERPEDPSHLTIVCTYDGSGELRAGGEMVSASYKKGAITIQLKPGTTASPSLGLLRTDPADPIRNIDCREQGMDKAATFAPDFVHQLQTFKVVRFMDWQNVNSNQGGKWADRATRQSQSQVTGAGVAVENLVLAANEAKVSPWFVLPYNADADYVRNFAQYVHDNLGAGQVAYFELGNEIWNTAFPASKQATEEGLRDGLSRDEVEARMLAYAKRAQAALAIVTAVYKDDPKRVVRVVSSQSTWSPTAEIILGYKPLLPYIDALAAAPYFYADMFTPPQDLDTLFQRVNAGIDQAIENSVANKAIAFRAGKRFIAYEGGQHITANGPLEDLMGKLQRDPRMGAAYARYLDLWSKKVGDLLVLYALTSPLGAGGSWGLREYSGQPMDEAPKLKAVTEWISKH